MRIGRAAGVTDTGRRRMRNEDAFVFEPPLFAIADGMGGARAGEVAAGIAAAALEETGAEPSASEASLDAVIVEANRRVWERSLADPSTAGMGTTVTARSSTRPGTDRVRPRRRLARVPPARRRARAGHDRPLARRRARRRAAS